MVNVDVVIVRTLSTKESKTGNSLLSLHFFGISLSSPLPLLPEPDDDDDDDDDGDD